SCRLWKDQGLQFDHLQPPRNLLGRDQVPFSRARADLARPLPGLGALHVALPERPGAALPRPCRVDRAVICLLVIDAFAVVILAQAAAVVERARVQGGKLRDGLAAEAGQGAHLFLIHPDEARRPGAAVPAARAPEAEAVLVPGFRHRTYFPPPKAIKRRHHSGGGKSAHFRRFREGETPAEPGGTGSAGASPSGNVCSPGPEGPMSVSVIIPALNEESCLAETLRLLRPHRPQEIIVVDGGSSDATCRLAAGADLLLRGPRGR